MKIVNIVTTGSFNQKVDLNALSAIGERYSYNRQKYIGGYITLSSVKVTVYRTGKYIIPGIRSPEGLESAWKELLSVLSPYLDISLFTPPEIKNMVAQTEFGKPVKLGKLIAKLHDEDEDAEYEPEVFPGLIWKSRFGSANIFQNGKIMLLGCKTIEELERLEAYVLKKTEEMNGE